MPDLPPSVHTRQVSLGNASMRPVFPPIPASLEKAPVTRLPIVTDGDTEWPWEASTSSSLWSQKLAFIA